MDLLPYCEYLYCHPWVFKAHWRLLHSHFSPGSFAEPLQTCLSAPSSSSTHSCWKKGTYSGCSRLIPIYCVPGVTPYWSYEEDSPSHLILAFLRFGFWPLSTKRGGRQTSVGGGSVHPQRWIPLYLNHSWWKQRVTNWAACCCPSFAFRRGDWWKEIAPGLRLNQQSLSRETLSMEECPPSHLLPIHQSTLLPNPQGTSVPEWQNCLLQACVGKRYMHQ